MSFLKKVGRWKSSSNGRHSKLSDEMVLQTVKQEEEEEEGYDVNIENNKLTFKLKYLGSTVIEKVLSDNMNQEAVNTIMKKSKKKHPRVNMTISLRGIVVNDSKDNELIKISIYRISKCCTHATHRNVFSFLSTDANETTECHAFLCSKRKVAETVALAVAHSFSMAYEAWRILPSTQEFQQTAIERERAQERKGNEIKTPIVERESLERQLVQQLITFDDSTSHHHYNQNDDSTHDAWVSFDDNNFQQQGGALDNGFDQHGIIDSNDAFAPHGIDLILS